MILGKLFKKKQDTAADQPDEAQDAAAQADSQADALPQEYQGDARPLAEKSAKKTKANKANTALRKQPKQRSNRKVHTERSFHRPPRKEVGEQVHIYDIIDRPLITEKAANQSERGVYAFLVQDRANKYSVADAIEALYGVRPKKVRIAKRPPKRKRLRIPGKEREYGMTAQKKKAYVFLREGDTIKLS